MTSIICNWVNLEEVSQLYAGRGMRYFRNFYPPKSQINGRFYLKVFQATLSMENIDRIDSKTAQDESSTIRGYAGLFLAF